MAVFELDCDGLGLPGRRQGGLPGLALGRHAVLAAGALAGAAGAPALARVAAGPAA